MTAVDCRQRLEDAVPDVSDGYRPAILHENRAATRINKIFDRALSFPRKKSTQQQVGQQSHCW
jgi:hypothetical protein